MTDNKHPITPPPELVQQWWQDPCSFEDSIKQAARWGADQELEACCEWLRGSLPGYDKHYADCLHTARRSKPPSLKEQALDRCNNYIDPDGIIRRALESLPN